MALTENIDAERAVLGAMLISGGAIEAVTDSGLAGRDFSRPSHTVIYDAIVALSDRGRVDELILINALRRQEMAHPDKHREKIKALELVGGEAYILGLLADVPATGNARAYADDVATCAQLRRIAEIGQELIRSATDPASVPDEVISTAAELVADAAVTAHDMQTTTAGEALDKLIDELGERIDTGMAPGFTTGLPALDQVLGGLHRSALYIVAGRPAMGKSSFGGNIADHLTNTLGENVLFFTLEMDAKHVIGRIISARERINGKAATQRIPTHAELERFAIGATRINREALVIDDAAALSAIQLRTRARRHARRLERVGKKLTCIVIDYMGLMTGGGGKFENRQVEMSTISRSLKALSRELNVAVVALCQLSRANESRTDKTPMLSDLRESGAIEQDADAVVFVHRPEYYAPKDVDLHGKAQLIVAKNRHGEIGTVWTAWLGQYTTFAPLSAGEFRPGMAEVA